nr:MAG TPA: hypothetical protein [Caudoviricetes sp.]
MAPLHHLVDQAPLPPLHRPEGASPHPGRPHQRPRPHPRHRNGLK